MSTRKFEQPILGIVDLPQNQEQVAGIFNIIGWVLTQSADQQTIEVRIDNQPIAIDINRVPRPDVSMAYENYAHNNPLPGFVIYADVLGFSSGFHTLTCIVRQGGYNQVIGQLTINIQHEGNEVAKVLIEHAKQFEAINKHLDRIVEMMLESKDSFTERTKSRWRNANPDMHLTWGMPMTGNNFIAKVASYAAFQPDKAILEMGPGYGRLLKAIFAANMPFSYYMGIDISAQNVAHLRQNFNQPNIEFIHSDAETVVLNKPFDVFISSLTLKHLYPSFEKALQTINQYANPGCTYFFDLPLGKMKAMEKDAVTFVRAYSKDEVQDILEQIGLTLIAFDSVQHDQGYERMLVVANKP